MESFPQHNCRVTSTSCCQPCTYLYQYNQQLVALSIPHFTGENVSLNISTIASYSDHKVLVVIEEAISGKYLHTYLRTYLFTPWSRVILEIGVKYLKTFL